MVLFADAATGAEIEADWDRAIRREQLAILIRQAPFLAVVNIVNALLVGVIVAGQAPTALVWAWTALIAFGALYPLRTWWRSRLPDFHLSGSERSIRRAVIQAAVAGALWALAVPAFAGHLNAQTEIFLYVVLAGMVAGGSITLSSLPAASLTYTIAIGTVVLAFVFRHYDDSTFVSLGIMLLLYFFVTGYASRTVFGSAMRALRDKAVEAERRRHVQHQFRDFAAAASDWFWESDASNRLTEVTGIRADLGPGNNGRFSGLSLHDLELLNPAQRGRLQEQLRAGARLHNEICALWDASGERRIVAVTALPLRDTDGGFRGYRGSFTDMSDVVAAQQRADSAETALSEAIEALDDGLIVYDAQDRVVTFNARHKEMFPSFADMLRPGAAYADMVRTQIERGQLSSAIGREEEAIAERIRRHQDPGQPEIQHFANGRIMRLTEKRTASGGIIALRTDITDLIEARQRAEQSERNLLTLLETAPVALWVSADGRFLFANRRAHRLLASDDDELVGQRVDRYYDDSRDEGMKLDREAQVERADGSVIWVAVAAADVFYQGRDARITGLIDITDRKRAEQRLRDSESRFRDFASSSGDWLWELDRDLRFAYMSDNVLRIHGLAPDWYYGKALAELPRAEEDTPRWNDLVETMTARQPFRDFVYRRHTVDGTCWLRVSGVPVFDADGGFAGYRGVGSDITAERDLQAQLLRTQKLESVGQLTGGIAHDFNNILGIVIGNLDLLCHQLGDGSQHEVLLQRAIKAGERGGELTKRLLAFSRRQPLDAQALDLPSLLGETGGLLEPALGQANHVHVDLPADLWQAHADAAELESAIVNLAINARDASPNGTEILIQARNLPADEAGNLAGADLAPGDYVTIAVTDRGEGMTPEVLERCCEPFFTTKEIGRGTGLGLSTIMGFAKQSGGDLLIDSTVGKGTAVTLVLPRAAPTTLARTG